MNRKIKKVISLLLALMIAMTGLLISPMSASAAQSPLTLESANIAIWADAENVLSQAKIDDYKTNSNKLATLGGIQPFKRSTSSTNYYWFFPSNADLSALRVWFAADSTVSIAGKAINSGDTTDAFASINQGGTTLEVTVTVNGTNYSVTGMKSGDVGTVYIDTNSGSLKTITSENHDTEEAGSIMVVQPDGTVDYMGVMTKMSGRGNGTWSRTGIKNPYNIKLAVSTSLLGMGSAKKWCLLANDGDNTLIKNQLTYDFAKYIGVKYQPICKPVDLYVNQQYLGSYQLSERVEIKTNRLDINDAYENLEIANGTVDAATGAIIPGDLTGTAVTTFNPNNIGTTTYNQPGHTVTAKRYSTGLNNPTDITGGYLYELEISNRWVNENAGFCAYARQGWVIKNADFATKEMVDYSYDLLFALGSSVYNNGTVPSKTTTTSCNSLSMLQDKIYGERNITNPAPATIYQGKKWSDILDAESAVKYYWTQEFFKNMDSSTSSTYFYKDSDAIDSMLYAGPVWDMDNSLGFDLTGSRWGHSWTSADDWYTKNSRIYRWRSSDSKTDYNSDDLAPLNFYAALATNCKDFWEMAGKYWYNLIQPATEILVGNKVDKTGTLKSTAEYVATVEKSGKMDALRLDKTLSSDVTAINNWITSRADWISSQISKTSFSSCEMFISTIDAQYYTGSEITPKVTIQIRKSGSTPVTLVENEDYSLSYENNINTGTATVTATGIGLYSDTVSQTFTIIPTPLSNTSAVIAESSYIDTNLKVDVLNSNGNQLTSGLSYQWYRNGVAISGATESVYLTTAEDAGQQITAVVTGDGVNLSGSVTSNVCSVSSGSKPQGYTKTIASWDYDYTVSPEMLVTADETGVDYYYLATGGENQSAANLYASVNAEDNTNIKWSGSADLYVNDSVALGKDRSPVMGTSKTDGLGWGAYPYFQTVVSTSGFEGIKFSAKLGGTKKAPRDWALQYSLDGVNFTDVAGSNYSIVANKTMEQAFDNVALPSACDNQRTVYIRAVVTNDIAINGINTIVNQVSGDASINNIAVTGTSISVITELNAPSISGNTVQFDNSGVTITDNNGGADVYYSVNGGVEALSTGVIYPFDSKTAKIGDTVEITAYAKFGDIVSDASTATFTFGGIDINDFSYDDYSKNVTLGAVASTGGVYGESGKMTGYTDGKSQYVPVWNATNKSFSISPDDGALWSENSGFTYKVSTAGYSNVCFSCMAYTTLQGPNSVTLQYSLDGETYYDVQSNVVLPAYGTLEQLFVATKLPVACDNKTVVYIRLATKENLTNEGNALHNANSKGNLYVNNVVISGEDDGSYKMPYTNKSTSFFSDTGVVKYVSPDNMPMQYLVMDSSGAIVQAGTYPVEGIMLSTVNGFDNTAREPYTIMIQVEEDENTSLVNKATYYYKGDTVVKFNYNSTTKLFTDYISGDGTSVLNTSGTNAGKLTMCPNGTTPAPLSYTGTYGVKVGFSAENPFTATKVLDNPSNNGYWLVETSSIGYSNLTLNLEQLSSNNGPRDWGVAYSLDGNNYTYVENSNVRAISNDSSTDTVETYGNLPLPSQCDNQEKLFIKIFINGGESVDGTELELVTKGNTGLNTFELNGVPTSVNVTVNATVLETPTSTEGTIPVANANVYVNSKLVGTTDDNGQLVIPVAYNKNTVVTIGGNNGIVPRDIIVKTTEEASVGAPVLMFDVHNDGYINVKDYVVMNKDSRYDSAKQYFSNFLNVKTSEFVYQ